MGLKEQLKQIRECTWQLPKGVVQGMRVPALIFLSEQLLADVEEGALQQAANVACLPGIYKHSIALPDMHFGYGFPIGGVAALDAKEGGISPGGVGYDINCGVRLLRTNLSIEDIKQYLDKLVVEIFHAVPSGVGRGGRVKLSSAETREVLAKGANWAVKAGYGTQRDLEHIEEHGCMASADPDVVVRFSPKAISRGAPQLGSLGAGNHFLEIQKVAEIYQPDIARVFGIDRVGQICVMIHTGSRGLGHQVCTDFLHLMETRYRDLIAKLPDRELIYAPAGSQECENYFKAMCASANFAWANRQMITHWVRESMLKVLGRLQEEVGLEVVYDVAHNIAKLEEHEIDGEKKRVYVHRKGGTRCFGPGSPDIPKDYQKIGQPVLVPGDMGSASYVLVGTQKAEEETFSSVCFAGNTNILTNKGILPIKDVYERIKNGEQMFVPSFNKKTFDIEWKKIERVSKRKGRLITIDVSQTGRVNGNTIDLTPNHKVLSIENLKIVEKEIEKILEENEMLCIVDKIPGIENTNQSNLAYLLGALFTDGYVQLTPNHGKVALIQKRTDEKIPFINTVKDCFEDVFGHPLTEGRTHTTTGIIRGQSITGTATEFICARKLPAESILKIKNNLVRWILSLDEDSLLNFLAGVIDGDGTWNKKHNVIQIYNGNEKVVHGIVLACLRLGIVPQISIQRKTCYNIQISEKLELLLRYTKRVKGNVRNRKYGTKLFAVKQLFKDYWKKMNWPFRQKANRNNLMNFKIILEHIHKYPQFKQRVMKIINSPLRMYRVKKVADIGQDFVFNLTVEDNHNYIVFTKNYTPVLVKNCHGAGRLLSRHAALKRFRGERVKAELAQRGISVRSASWGVLAEEAPGVYKNIHEVVRVCEVAGLSKTVAKLVPIGVVKG